MTMFYFAKAKGILDKNYYLTTLQCLLEEDWNWCGAPWHRWSFPTPSLNWNVQTHEVFLLQTRQLIPKNAAMCATTSGFASVSFFRWNINFTFLKSQKELARQDKCTKSKGNPLLHSAMALEELGSWKGVDILSKTRKERWPVCRWPPWPWISTWALSLRGRRGSRRSWSWTTFIAISGGQTKTLINPIRTSLFEHIWRPWGGLAQLCPP